MHRMHPRDFLGGQRHRHVVAQGGPLCARENAVGIVLNLVGSHIHEPFPPARHPRVPASAEN